ncbi:MAG: heparan-alpha-glucosaminide N-acetyltransferase [Chloroflexota bacterium]
MGVASRSTRLWEVDTLRGLAIIEMVFFHFVWDLHYFGLYQANVLSGPWQIFARNIASTFLFVLGLSLTLSHNRASQHTGRADLFLKYLRRGGQIFGLGLVITGATYFFIGRGFVIFGILHLLGLSIIGAYPFLGRGRWPALLGGLLAIGLGIYLNQVIVSFPWLIWLGLPQAGRYMVDYYPFLPWFGVALLGVFAGYSLYSQGVRRFRLPDLSQVAPVRGLRFLGRHSLLIYLVHQPILIGIFMALGYGQ